jgi:hypothetical protein
MHHLISAKAVPGETSESLVLYQFGVVCFGRIQALGILALVIIKAGWIPTGLDDYMDFPRTYSFRN